MIKRMLLTTAAAMVMMVLSTVARADEVGLQPSANNTGVSAQISNYTLSGNQFCFTITNTSSFGSITAIGFDLSGTRSGFSLMTPNSSSFRLANNVRVQAGAPTSSNTFDFALLTGNNFGGGNVSAGIAPGQSMTFCVTGNFSGLTADQIAQAVFARFQGIGARDLSDVVGVTPNAPIPEPMTIMLLGTGLAGTAASIRRRRQKAQQ